MEKIINTTKFINVTKIKQKKKEETKQNLSILQILDKLKFTNHTHMHEKYRYKCNAMSTMRIYIN